MDSRKALISEIFNNTTLIETPFFQRAYVWKEDLWSRFLDDMIFVSKTNTTHFVGSIILKDAPLVQRSSYPYSSRKILVDGQQRLTTLLLLLRVLALKTNSTMAFDIQFKIMCKDLALRHGKNDYEAFNEVMSLSVAQKINNTGKKSTIIDAFNYYIDNLDPSLLNYMSIITYTQFVRIDLFADENEQQIFDSLNSLGVNLTTAELLKNYFYCKDSINEYKNTWVEVFEKDDDVKEYWDTELEVGRVKRTMIDIFFNAYFQMFIQDKKYNIKKEDKDMYERQDNLSLSYQHFINNYCNGDKSIVTSAIKAYASCFMRIFNPNLCYMAIPSYSCLERINVIIFGLKNSTLIPYILYLENNVKDKKDLNHIYSILESYIMRRLVCHYSTKNYNNLFTSLILNKVIDANTLLSRLNKGTDIPTDSALDSSFIKETLANNQTKGIIYFIESALRKDINATTILGFNHYSLEHLMPKKWKNNWAPTGSDVLDEERDNILLTLGNLAIIPQTLNVKIRDASWNIKKNGSDKKPGLIKCASGLYTLQDVLEKNEWNESEIKNRAKWMSEQAKKIWTIA